MQETKTPNLTHFVTLDKSPSKASFRTEITLIPHVLAIDLALSISILSPTLPVSFISPFINGTWPEIKTKLLVIT